MENLGFWAVIVTIAGVSTTFALGLQLQVGQAGVLNFGQVGFMAVGAYSIAIMARYDQPLWVGLLCGLAGALVFALIVGVPSLRLRADYLAITTIAASEIVRYLALNLNSITGGPSGLRATADFREQIHLPILQWFRDSGYPIDRILPLLVLFWLVAALALAALLMLSRAPWGRTLRAVREDEDAARALGKNAFAYKLQALAIGGVLGAVAGQMYAFYLGTISPTAFEPMHTFIGFVIIIVGGLSSLWAVPLAALLIHGLLEGTRYLDISITGSQEAALRFLVVGVLLMLLAALRPQGIFGKREEMVLEK